MEKLGHANIHKFENAKVVLNYFDCAIPLIENKSFRVEDLRDRKTHGSSFDYSSQWYYERPTLSP